MSDSPNQNTLMFRIKKAIHKMLIRTAIGDHTPVETFSQMGEDRILQQLFAHKIGEQKTGFYVDIGAYDPIKYSNTWFFYKRGWKGVNVEARPGSRVLFDRLRPRDVNLEMAVSESSGSLSFLMYDESSTINRLAQDDDDDSHQITVATTTLNQIFSEHVPHGQQIDFLSIDIEGEDERVVLSTDWKKYRPSYILAESRVKGFADAVSLPMSQYLRDHGYLLFDSCKSYWPPRPQVVGESATTLFFASDEVVN